MSTKTIPLSLSVDQVNYLVATLAEKPYKEVTALLEVIVGQARSEIERQNTPLPSIPAPAAAPVADAALPA